MNLNRLLPVLFFVVLALEIFGAENDLPWMVFIFKPLLIPILWTYLRIGTDTSSPVFRGLQAALLFSWIGDIVLIFGTDYFLLGLGCFFLAQVSYTVLFFRQSVNASLSLIRKIFIALPFLIYLAFFLNLMLPELGLRPDGAALKTPLVLYGIMITAMGITALWRPRSPKGSFTWVSIGAVFFIASDSLLAYDRFLDSLPAAALSVMITYGIAQFGIIHGSKFYLKA